MELILMVGPPGSGKTTYAQKHYPNHVRISQDEQGRQGHKNAFHCEVYHRRDIVVDRMNHTREQRERYSKPAIAAGYTVRIVVLQSPPEECLRRMVARPEHPTIKDETTALRALRCFQKNYEEPAVDEATSIEFLD